MLRFVHGFRSFFYFFLIRDLSAEGVSQRQRANVLNRSIAARTALHSARAR